MLFNRLYISTFLKSKRYVQSKRYVANSQNEKPYDVTIIGGGIVGVATAKEILTRHPNLRMAILEKESQLACHQSGHNSGVVHAGIYYKPGSLKAELCVKGLQLAYKYFDERSIPYKKVGKLIVATNKTEIERLMDLYQRGLANKVPGLEVIAGEAISQIEPMCRGEKALYSPETGIVDWALVTKHMGTDFTNAGGEIFYNCQVSAFKESLDAEYPVTILGKRGEKFSSKVILTCAGLHSDKVAEMSGCPSSPRIVPFRGEYLLLRDELAKKIKGNIYPVPDPRFPFLGVHFTPRMDGSVWLGPNAVLAFSREGYSRLNFNLSDLKDTIGYSGTQKLAMKYMGAGLKEMIASVIKHVQVKELKKFVPSLTVNDVSSGPSGVRAQAVDKDGNLIEDFHFDECDTPISKHILHCRNAPSPGATSSMAIAKMIADKMENKFHLSSFKEQNV